MKALTLTQPWAHLVAVGAKRVETRSWPTPYRGPLAIHAAQGWGEPDRRFAAAAWGYLYAIGEVDAEEVSLLSWMAAIDGERGCVIRPQDGGGYFQGGSCGDRHLVTRRADASVRCEAGRGRTEKRDGGPGSISA